MKMINLTPHAIILRDQCGVDHVVAPSGIIARVKTTPGVPEIIEGIPVPLYSPQTWGEVEGLPPIEGDTIYIVSRLVLDRLSNFPGVFCSPGTGPDDKAIREPEKLPDGQPNPKKGMIIAVTRLVR